MNHIITTKNLVFKDFIYYNDIEIPQGEVSFLTGASGAGKSTLFKLINKTADRSAGQIFYNGKSIDEYDPIELRSEIMLIGQDVYLFDMTIKQNFEQFYHYLEKPMISDDEIAVYLNLASVDFELDKKCSKLSGGEKQRVFIAIHLSLKPKVMLLDEPTSALDRNTGIDMIKNVVEFSRSSDITLVVVSHNDEITTEFSKNTIKI